MHVQLQFNATLSPLYILIHPVFSISNHAYFPIISFQVVGQAASDSSVTMSNSGDKVDPSSNQFAVNTTGNPSMLGFGTNNSAANAFAANTTSNPSTSAFGNMTNSTHNPFAANTTGNASSTSVSGNPNNSAFNPFASNANGNASLSTFGNMTNAAHNPFAVNSPSNASVSVFGNPSNPPPDPFAITANGNASKSVFWNPGNPPPNPFTLNTNGNASMSVFGNPSNPPPNPFAVKPPENLPMPIVGDTNTSTCNPFAINTFSNTTSPSFPFRSITFDGTSTGAFGELPSSVQTRPSIFGPTETSGSPAAFTNHMRNNAFGWGPGGSPPSSFSQSSGLKFGPSSNALFGTKGLMTSTSAGTNISVSNAGPFSHGSTKPCSSSLFSFGVTQASTGLNKGSKIKPYAATKNAENWKEKFLSISCMPVYESKCHEELRWEDYELKSGGTSSLQNPFNTVSKGSSFSPVSQFPVSNITPTNLNPVSPSPIPSLNFTPFSPTTAASLSNSSPSSTTTPVFTHPSSPFRTPSFPIQDPSSNSTPSTNITSVFSQPPSSVLNTSFPSLTPSSNSTASSFFPAKPLNLIPPSMSSPSSFTKWPFTPTESGNSVPNTSFPTPTPSFTSTAPSLIQASNTENSLFLNRHQPPTSNPWTFTQPSTLTETGKSQIHPAPSAWESYNSPGNHGGSTDKAVDCIIAVKDPFGPQSVSSHPLTDHRICSPLIQNGISCMPVIDKPATTRISPLVTSRYISQRPLTVRARKYNPKSDGPRVPFFDHIDETQNTQKESTFIIPRENPRSVFEATPKLSGVRSAKVDVIDASTLLHDGGLKSKTDEASSSTPCSLECQKSVSQKWQQVNPSASVPKLHRLDYYTQPSIQELLSAESNDPGFCSHVQDFVVGRHGYGEVKFEGETDVRGMDLDALVYFNKREVIVYEDEHERPEIGEGLNKRAEVTLLNVKCSDKTGKEYKSGKMVDKFLEKLTTVAEDQGAEFVSYDAVNGVWKFQVQHF